MSNNHPVSENDGLFYIGRFYIGLITFLYQDIITPKSVIIDKIVIFYLRFLLFLIIHTVKTNIAQTARRSTVSSTNLTKLALFEE